MARAGRYQKVGPVGGLGFPLKPQRARLEWGTERERNGIRRWGRSGGRGFPLKPQRARLEWGTQPRFQDR